MNKEHYSLRLNIIFGLFVVLFLIVSINLFKIQVLSHDKYVTMAEEQYWDFQTIPSRRGNIFTSDGYLVAGTKPVFLLFAEPKLISDKFKLIHDVADVLSTSRQNTKETKEQLFSSYYERLLKLVDSEYLWIPLDREVSVEEKKLLEERNIKGIGFEESSQRYYPENSLASHVLGFVASDDSGEKRGYYGIEGALNDDLKGKNGRIVEEKDATGASILIGGYRRIDPISGRDIVLTINRSIQNVLEKRLAEGVEKYDAVSASGIIMDPFTGDIIAMANYPTYDPQNFGESEIFLEKSPHRKNIERSNHSISYTYEPGSVIKPLTVSAAIDLGLVTPDTTFVDEGVVKYSDYYINNWDGKHHGVQTVTQLLQKSNNIGAAWVGTQVGASNLYDYFKKFGLARRSGIELEGEDTGILNPPATWTDIDLATASFGQGISATPLQVITAFNVIANGGTYIEPKIISKLNDVSIPVKERYRVLKPTTAKTMQDLLEKAVEGGEAKYYVVKDYRVAGKTGTAQIPEQGKYSKDKTNATFVGFLAGDKKISMIIKIQEPRKSIYAAETAVPLWMEILHDLVKFYGIAPDKVVVEETQTN